VAAKAVDRITGRYSPNVESGWQDVEMYLQQAYQAVSAALMVARRGWQTVAYFTLTTH
jgi:hypothetical protein